MTFHQLRKRTSTVCRHLNPVTADGRTTHTCWSYPTQINRGWPICRCTEPRRCTRGSAEGDISLVRKIRYRGGFCKTSAFQQKYCPGVPLVHYLELAGRFCKLLRGMESLFTVARSQSITIRRSDREGASVHICCWSSTLGAYALPRISIIIRFVDRV